ncbi:MAG TPA: hypothetical protein PLO89_06370 [Spirochaetota bacterium]|nr:hypothetical protein [Spirochaetota bacterium]
MKKIFFCILICASIFTVNAQDRTSDAPKKNMNGWDYYSAGRYQDSLNALIKEKKIFPDRINIYVIMAWNYRELKNYTEMETISLEGLKYQPTDTRILKNLAEAYFFQKKYQDSANTFEKYIKYKFSWNDPYLSYSYYYLGICYYYLQHYRKADIALSTAIYYVPKNFNTLILLAEIKEILGEFNKARSLFVKAGQIAPNNKRVNDGLARIKDKV